MAMNNIWKEIVNFDLPNDIRLKDFILDKPNYNEVILFIAVLSRLGYTDEVNDVDSQTRQKIDSAIRIVKGPHHSVVIEAYEEYISILDTISDKLLHELVVDLRKVKGLDSRDFHSFVEDLISSFSRDTKDDIFSYRLPAGLVELMHSICKFPTSNPYNVYIPYSGLGDLFLGIPSNVSIDAQEFYRRASVISKLRAISSYPTRQVHLTNADPSGRNWNYLNKTYNLVLSTPPFGQRIPKGDVQGRFGEIQRIDPLIIEKGLDAVDDTGRVVLLIAPSFLFASDSYSISLKKLLIENNYIESIITLPGKIFSHTAIRSVILVLNKGKVSKDVVFVDATECISTKEGGLTIDAKEVLRLLDSSESSVQRKVVPVKEIVENNFSLAIGTYNVGSIEGTPLKEILVPCTGQKASRNDPGRLVKLKSLKSSISDYVLKTDELEIEKITLRHREISQSCVLLAANSKDCKPTYFHYEGTPIYIGENILAIIPDESRVTIDFIIYLLHTSKVQSQIGLLQTGTTIPRVSINDILNIKVDLPNYSDQGKNFEYQKQIVQEAIANEDEKQLLSINLNAELDRQRRQFDEELREKQHCIRQHLKNVMDSIYVIRRFLKENGSIALDDVINPLRNVTVAQRLEATDVSLRALALEINSLANDELYDKAELLGIQNCLEECILEHSGTDVFTISLELDEIALAEFGDGNPPISISMRSFKELFNNIVQNATIHGFSASDKKYLIKIKVAMEDGKLRVTFLNNGKPLAQGISKQLGVKGKKAGINAGSGIGAWKIFQIAKHYGFECEIIDQPESEFPVGWNLTFNLNNLD